MGSPDLATRHRAEAVAAAMVRHADRSGADLPDDLLIWSLASRRPIAPAGGFAVEDPSQLAEVLETVTAHPQRRANGLHVTPAWLADRLVALTLDGLAPAVESAPAGDGQASGAVAVCDPACGGGAFLLAAARALHAAGVSRREVVTRCLWGADIDPVGLATAEAALTLWAGVKPPDGRLVVGDALASGAALWGAARPFDAVVGNPPFLNQLAAATARSEADRVRLRRKFGDAVQPYTDTAWLFLLAACDLVRPGGRVALIQPMSLVAARDANRVRAALERRAELRDLWVEDRSYFAAQVRVCCPVLELRRAGEQAGDGQRPRRDGRAAGRSDATWAERLADALGVPRVTLRGTARLGDRANVTAGFRDEYYGLVPFVREAAGATDRGSQQGLRPLITAGVLEWGRCVWGERPTRFARQRWTAPVADATQANGSATGGTAEARAAAWLARTAVPKVVVATQTRVVEAAVDESGAWVPSVPSLAVLPTTSDDLWLLAAAIASPAATAWLLRRTAGTALSRHTMRIAARDLATVPLPVDRGAWIAAADAFKAYGKAPRGAADADAFDGYCDAIARAYEAPRELETWWRQRL